MKFSVLDVEINGQKRTVAGGPDLSVLNAIVSFPSWDSAGDDPRVELSVGGLCQEEEADSDPVHKDWISQITLPYGSWVTIRFRPADRADPPIKATPTSATIRAQLDQAHRGPHDSRSRSDAGIVASLKDIDGTVRLVLDDVTNMSGEFGGPWAPSIFLSQMDLDAELVRANALPENTLARIGELVLARLIAQTQEARE